MKVKFILLVVLGLGLGACSNQDQARAQASQKAENRNYYVMKNDMEFNNYNRRLQIADDPTTILWCTSSFPQPNSPLFTVPIVGKLTSGSKRPFPDDPGPDAMYGTSGDYRYGFSPAGVYEDFYNLPTYCSTEPTIWQRESTKLVLATDPTLLAAQQQARALLKAGKTAEAQAVLEAAIAAVSK